MGTPYTPEYARFRDELEAYLRDQCGVDPRIIGKNEYPTGSPLSKIREVMATCDGVIIVAYERKHVSKGSEKRGSEAETTLSNRSYTTPWNHIESAMAFSLSLPLHILCQTGLSEEGLIETKVDWYVQRLDIVSGAFNNLSVTQSLQSWIKERVLPHANRPSFFRAVQGQSRLSEMTPVEILGVLGVLAAAFGAGVWAAHVFPQIFP
jgi:hypothetical protein